MEETNESIHALRKKNIQSKIVFKLQNGLDSLR